MASEPTSKKTAGKKGRKAWSKVVDHRGIKIRLYERPGGIYRSFVVGRVVSKNGKPRTVQDRRCLRHKDRKRAEAQAKTLAVALADQRALNGPSPAPLTLGRLVRLWRAHRAPLLEASGKTDRRVAVDVALKLFLGVWGDGLRVDDIDQTRVDRFAAARRAGEVSPLGRTENGKGRAVVKVSDGTINGDFRSLSSVLNWARKYKMDGRYLLAKNPLHDCELPKEKNVRRPVASHSRYTRTRERCDTVDPTGRLRTLLDLVRYTGRRIEAATELLVSDVLLTRERIEAVLAEKGMDERLADHMPYGAIHWPSETDKKGYRFITPIGSECRAALDAYLLTRAAIGDAPLFPAPKAEGAIDRRLVTRWLIKAEKLAKLPKLERGVWHPYRRLWAIERKHLPVQDVAEAAGWRDTRSLQALYQQADPATVLRVVENA